LALPLQELGDSNPARAAKGVSVTEEHHSLSRLEVDVWREGASTTIELRGELDLAGVPLLQEVLEREEKSGTARALIDLGRLDFVDSTGLRALLQAKRHADDDDGLKVAMSPPTGEVARLLELTGLRAVLPFLPETSH
jgi:anti-sigma B factor antagonist